MNVSEYLVSFLEEKGVDRVFGVVGGAALWICKALSETDKISPVFTNHEQAATMAADGWARLTGKPGVIFTINGPGMTNTVTGIAQAWVDSSPLILITGNSNLNSVKFERENGIRQYGTQDVRTDEIMKSITKKTFLLESAADARRCFEEAYRLSISGRPGPVCIEIPINIQSAEVLEENILDENVTKDDSRILTISDVETVASILAKAERPLILAGQGIRLADSVSEFREFIETYQIPVVNSRMGIDTIETNSRLFVGRAGNHGSRASHFAIQTCDVLLVLGSRLAPNTTGYDVSKFSNQSYKILVDIEQNELKKNGIRIDKAFCCDVKQFLENINKVDAQFDSEKRSKWIACCNDWKNKYPILMDSYYSNPNISTYRVVDEVSKLAGDRDLILSDTGSCCSIVAQVWNVKTNQRVFISGGLSAMGYWATSMGLAVANTEKRNVICFVGDGSLQMNIHELATIKAYGLPVKLFVISNNGYQFVKMSQGAYGMNPPFGTDIEGGVPIPNIKKIVEAYELNYSSCDSNEKLIETIRRVIDSDKAEVCEIFVDENQEVCPRLKSVALKDGTFVSPQYENLYPFLEENVVRSELNRAL